MDSIWELFYTLPEKRGWLLVFSKEPYQRFLSKPRFRFVLKVSGNQIDSEDYGIYKASELRGQAMSGLKFSHLTEKVRSLLVKMNSSLMWFFKTKVKIMKANSQAKVGTSDFLEVMENLLCSKQPIPCIFLECLETSARPRQVSDPESTDRDVNGLCTIHPFPSEDLTSVGSSLAYPPFIVDEGSQQLSAISVEQPFEDIPIIPPRSSLLQLIANWGLRRRARSRFLESFPLLSHETASRNIVEAQEISLIKKIS